jgi:cytochrome c553
MKRTLLLIMAILGAAAATAQADGAKADNAKANWKVYCAMCHGPKGKGDTPAGKLLGAPNYRDPKVQASFTDEAAFQAIKNGIEKDGRKKMKSFASELTDQDIHDLVQYIRSFNRGK